ncbi:fluoride efflux transporter FluC [Lapillicoccus jejuensis]|uniref:Fluoride-specific ion channel FluC n=1 Tax=Lapillicoccus jejuensis TaxID=402171 RepID=A0A542E2N8_9MICO|nr:CrcB family protein [Lapillicoccus jejuensis]TQJ09591.1 CrcB protein [Lapillicoccus jejuensis]
MSARHDPEDPDLDPDLDPVTPATPPDVVVAGVVALGGVVGSLGRWGVALGLPTAHHGLPWATLLVNVSGSLALGLLLGLLGRLPRAHPLWRPALGTGVLGGWTTFSTLTSETRDLLGHAPGVALAYVALSLLLGLAAALAGLRLATRLPGLPGPPGPAEGRAT